MTNLPSFPNTIKLKCRTALENDEYYRETGEGEKNTKT
jgi:hypothetical protein